MSRVVFLHGSNDLYGASRVLLDDVRLLRAQGRPVRVVVPYDGPLTPLLVDAGADVVVTRLRVLRRAQPSSTLAWPWRLPVPGERGDVVVVWTLALATYLPALLACRVPTVVSVHEILPGRLGSALGRLAAANRGPIMANSRATARWLAGLGATPGRTRVVYPVAPSRRAPPNAGANGSFDVLVAGRISARKGHALALEAVARLRDLALDARMTVAGAPFRGQEAALAALLARFDGLPWASYIGEVDDLGPVLHDHDVLLVASVEPESFGLVALEAWAAGRRVVAPDEEGAGEAARLVDGLVYRPRDAESMAAALRWAACEPALRRPPSADAPVAAVCTAERRQRFWDEALAELCGRRGRR